MEIRKRTKIFMDSDFNSAYPFWQEPNFVIHLMGELAITREHIFRGMCVNPKP